MTVLEQKRNTLLEGPVLTSLLSLAFPIVIANILQAGYQLTDAFWVGRLGGNAVAAVAVSGPIVFLSVALGVGFAVAGSTLIAQYFGAKNQQMVNHVSAQTLLMIVVVSVVLGTIGYVCTPFILTLMGVAPEVLPGATGFLRFTFIGLVFNFFFFMFQSIMRGVGEARLPVYIVFGTVLLNFLLDPLFIFGWGPVPALGVMGAAVATVSTQSIAALVGLLVLLRGKYGIHLSLSDFKPDWAFINRAFRLGLPASIEQSGRALGMTVMTFLVASFGTLTVAAYGVGGTVVQVIMIPAMGLSMALSTLVGQNMGAGNTARAFSIARLGAWLGFGVLSVFGVVVFATAPYLAAFFVPGDADVIVASTVFLRTVSLSWGFMGLQFALTGVLRATGNMMATMVLTLVSQWVIQFPLAYILSKHTSLGVTGLWWAFAATYILTALITLGWYAKGEWASTSLVTDEEKFAEHVTEEIITEEGVRG